MDMDQLDALARLDTELPIADPKLNNMTARLLDLVGVDTLRVYHQGYREGLRRFLAEYAAGAPFSIAAMFAAVHQTLPVGVDPKIRALLDERLTRYVEIGANIASAGSSPM